MRILLQECKRLVARHAWVAVLAVAHVIRATLVVCLARLPEPGGLGGHDAVVGVRVGERVEPWGQSRRGIQLKRFVPRVPIGVDRVLHADHVELGGVAAVDVVERVGLGVDLARGWVARALRHVARVHLGGRPGRVPAAAEVGDALRLRGGRGRARAVRARQHGVVARSAAWRLALAADLAAVVVDRVVAADAGDGQRARVGLRAVGGVVVGDEARRRVGVDAVDRLVLAHESDVVAGLDEGALDVYVISSLMSYLRNKETKR